jgi:hypothetical protein
MTGKHKATATRPALRIRRSRLVEMVDARTGAAHWLTSDALAAGHRAGGRYIALCDADVLPHSLTAPPLDFCRACLVPDQKTKARRWR